MSADVVLSLDYERGVLHKNKLSQNRAQSDTEEDVKLKNIYKKRLQDVYQSQIRDVKKTQKQIHGSEIPADITIKCINRSKFNFTLGLGDDK